MFTARCVPNMYLFGTFSAQKAPKTAPSPRPSRQLAGTRVRMRRAPRLHALGRAAVSWVEEYGHPAASDATEGRTVAKKTAFRAAERPKTIRLGFVWRKKRRFQCRDGSVTSLTREERGARSRNAAPRRRLDDELPEAISRSCTSVRQRRSLTTRSSLLLCCPGC